MRVALNTKPDLEDTPISYHYQNQVVTDYNRYREEICPPSDEMGAGAMTDVFS